MYTKVLTVSALLAVASALNVGNALQARDVKAILEKRQDASCTLNPSDQALIESIPTPSVSLDPCNTAAITSFAGSPEYTPYLSSVMSWEAQHLTDLTNIASSLAAACPALLSSLSEGLTPGGAGGLCSSTDGSSASTTAGAGAGSAGTTTTGAGSSSTASSSGLKTSSSGSKTAASTGASSTSTGSAAQQTLAAYAGAAIIGAMGVIAAL